MLRQLRATKANQRQPRTEATKSATQGNPHQGMKDHCTAQQRSRDQHLTPLNRTAWHDNALQRHRASTAGYTNAWHSNAWHSTPVYTNTEVNDQHPKLLHARRGQGIANHNTTEAQCQQSIAPHSIPFQGNPSQDSGPTGQQNNPFQIFREGEQPMSIKEQVLALAHLGDSNLIVRALCDQFKIDIDREASRLNTKAGELGLGSVLITGAREMVDSIIRAQRTGPFRTYAFEELKADPGASSGSPDALAADVRAGVQSALQENAARRVGQFSHILDNTVKDIGKLATWYRRMEAAFGYRANALESLMTEATRRGLSESDPLRNAFTEGELEAMFAKPGDSGLQPIFDFAERMGEQAVVTTGD